MGIGLLEKGLQKLEISLDGDCKDKERRRTRLCLAFRGSGGLSLAGMHLLCPEQQGRSPEPAFALPVCDLPKVCLSDWVQSCTFWDHLTCICHLLLSPDLGQPAPGPISKAASQKHTADSTYVNLSHKITRNLQTMNYKVIFKWAGLCREEKEPHLHTNFA